MTSSNRNASSSSSSRRRWWIIGGLVALLLLLLAPLTAVGVSVKLENHDSFCAGCHTQPETTYVQRAQSGSATDLASFHAAAKEPVACIDCHSGSGTMGRKDALLLGAHDLTAFVTRRYTQPAKLTHAIADENCLKCHGDIAKAQTFQNHFHALQARWQAIQPDAAAHCVDCHSSHTTDGEQQIAFLNKPRTVEQCNACHRMLSDD